MNMQVTSLKEMDNLEVGMKMDLVKVPAAYWQAREYVFPVGNQQLTEATFGASLNPLSDTIQMTQPGVTTSLIRSNEVNTPFLLRAVSVVITIEPLAFGLTGAAVPAVTSAAATPAFSGVVPFNAQDQVTRPAVLKWGHDARAFGWALLNAYRLRMKLNGKFELFDELAAYMGKVECDDGWNGDGGDSLIPAHEYIRFVNDRARLMGRPSVFIPPNWNGQTDESSAPLAPPMASVNYADLRALGTFGGWYPVKGVLLLPGMPIQMELYRDPGDVVFWPMLIQAAMDQGRMNIDSVYTEIIAGNIGYSCAEIFKGSRVKVGIAMKGYELAPRCCVEWYTRFAGGFGQCYTSALGAISMLQGYSAQVGLGALPQTPGNELVATAQGLGRAA